VLGSLLDQDFINKLTHMSYHLIEMPFR